MSRFIKSLQLLPFILCLSTATYSNDAKKNQLVFSRTSAGSVYSCAEDSLKTAYKALGYSITFIELPNRRALADANSGKVDGEMARVEEIELNYPNLVRIPVPLCTMQAVLVTKKSIELNELSDLKKYKIGITAGFVMQEKLVASLELNSLAAITKSSLKKMIRQDRVDIGLLVKPDAEAFVKHPKNKNFVISPNFTFDIHLYHYVHKKHDSLITSITQQLQNLAQAGKINTLKRTLKSH